MHIRSGAARRIAGAAALLAAVALVAGCASAVSTGASRSTPVHPAAARSTASSAVAPAPTVVHVVQPFAANGALTVAVGGASAGSCFTTSAAAPSRSTYRCFGGAGGASILDPCFAPATGSPTTPSTVACLAEPWAKAVVLTLAAPLPAPAASTATRLWALQLADGTRCVAATGTVPVVAGVNLSYACADGTDAQPVDPSARTVVVQRARPGAAVLQRSVVSAAWRA